jgi:hypothetical protein
MTALRRVVETLDASWKGGVAYVSAEETIGILYRDRIGSGGRIERYFGRLLEGMPLTENASVSLVVNGTIQVFHPFEMLVEARETFFGFNWAAPSHGDITDTNICVDASGNIWWIDPDTAGVVAIAGEFACILVNLWAHGCWLTPAYSPDRYKERPHVLSSVERNQAKGSVRIDGNNVVVTIERRISKPRNAAIRMIVNELVTPWTEKLSIQDQVGWLRPWLVARLIGVFNPNRLSEAAHAWQLTILGRLENATSLSDLFDDS